MIVEILVALVVLIAIVFGAAALFGPSTYKPERSPLPELRDDPKLNTLLSPSLHAASLTLDGLLLPPPLHIDSFAGTDETYIVDLAARTCTCPDFIKRRAALPQQSALRLCKHAASVLLAQPIASQINPMLACAYSDEFYSSWDQLMEFPLNGISIGVGIKAGTPWVNIIAAKPSKAKRPRPPSYQRYGFNIEERRWAYREAAPQATAIIAWVDQNIS